MDPLSCLAIAGAVVQFIDFGHKIITEARALYEGESKIRRQAARATSDLQDFSTRFDQSLGLEAQQRDLTEEEQTLRSLCVKCKNLADSLASKLDSLNVKEKHRVWSCLSTALSNVWSKKDILKMQEDLTGYRCAIDTCLVGLIRNSVTVMAAHQSLRFNTLDQETQQIVEGLVDLRSFVAEELKTQTIALTQLLNRQEAVIRSQTDVNTRIVVNVYGKISSHGEPTEEAPYEACKAIQMEEAKLRRSVASSILRSLRFSMKTQRFDDVNDAHHETFNWIFQHPKDDPEGREWDDFVQWLEDGGGVYWINGKAGSGKSTLLKRICLHPRTKYHLNVWKGDLDLHIASFFFWSSGTSLQKSQMGLLRSLLHDILSKVPQLIPVLFPSQWGELYLQKLALPEQDPICSWSLSTLLRAFETLLSQTIVSMKLCLFIDGLDEYSGLDSEIAKLFKNAAHAPHVKVCVSSRPHLVFKESFETQPQLRLEDLTKGDIKKYIIDMLENDEQMERRRDRESVQMRQLVNEIVNSASGVFLWVKLIVLDLRRGLENHDRISQLYQRLKNLPTDLEELYEHMIFKVDRVYKVEASQFYQLVAAATERDDDWRPAKPLTLLALYLATQDNYVALTAKTMFLSKSEIQDGICEADLSLRKSCGGLLETQFGKSNIRDIAPDMKVSYIHRTVKDYLDSTGIRHILSDRTGGLSAGSFNPNLALMRAYILQLKALECMPSNAEEAEELIHSVITFARRAELDLCEPNTELVQEFFWTVKRWWHKFTGFEGQSMRECVITDESSIILAIKFGLNEYLRTQLAACGIQADRAMLNCALYPSASDEKMVSKAIVTTLLEAGADPNEKPNLISDQQPKSPYERELQTPWQNALTYLACEFPYIRGREENVLLRRWEGIIKLLLQNGARTDIRCKGPKKKARAQRFEFEKGTIESTATSGNVLDSEKVINLSAEPLVDETILTPREVLQKTFEKMPEVLAGLLRLMDVKSIALATAAPTIVDPQLSSTQSSVTNGEQQGVQSSASKPQKRRFLGRFRTMLHLSRKAC